MELHQILYVGRYVSEKIIQSILTQNHMHVREIKKHNFKNNSRTAQVINFNKLFRFKYADLTGVF